jgi:hypothetical protein
MGGAELAPATRFGPIKRSLRRRALVEAALIGLSPRNAVVFITVDQFCISKSITGTANTAPKGPAPMVAVTRAFRIRAFPSP